MPPSLLRSKTSPGLNRGSLTLVGEKLEPVKEQADPKSFVKDGHTLIPLLLRLPNAWLPLSIGPLFRFINNGDKLRSLGPAGSWVISPIK